MANHRIQSTRNYRMFTRSTDNRETNIRRHKKLEASMRKYGFIPDFPIVVRRVHGRLVVVDGQHRLTIAESLGLPVYWTETKIDFSIAEINGTAVTWSLLNYARKFADDGIEDYIEALAFKDQHGLPISMAFALLAGTTSFGNFDHQFKSGQFRVKDREHADAVAGIYSAMVKMDAAVRNNRFLEACMAICRVDAFESRRLLSNANRCRDKLASYSTRDAYLQMLEDIYNFGRGKLFPLKVSAMMAMKERNAVKKKPQDVQPPQAEAA